MKILHYLDVASILNITIEKQSFRMVNSILLNLNLLDYFIRQNIK